MVNVRKIGNRSDFLKRIRKNIFVVGILSLVMILATSVFGPNVKAAENTQELNSIFKENQVPSSVHEIDDLLKEQIVNPPKGFTKEEAKANYEVFQNKTDSEKKELLDIFQNPDKLISELEKSNQDASSERVTSTIINDNSVFDAQPMKDIKIRYSGRKQMKGAGIHAFTYEWVAEVTTKDRSKAISDDKWDNHIGYKNPLFLLYDISRIGGTSDKYISKGKFYGKAGYRMKLGFKGYGFQAGRFYFTTVITPKKSAKGEVSTTYTGKWF